MTTKLDTVSELTDRFGSELGVKIVSDIPIPLDLRTKKAGEGAI